MNPPDYELGYHIRAAIRHSGFWENHSVHWILSDNLNADAGHWSFLHACTLHTLPRDFHLVKRLWLALCTGGEPQPQKAELEDAGGEYTWRNLADFLFTLIVFSQGSQVRGRHEGFCNSLIFKRSVVGVLRALGSFLSI